MSLTGWIVCILILMITISVIISALSNNYYKKYKSVIEEKDYWEKELQYKELKLNEREDKFDIKLHEKEIALNKRLNEKEKKFNQLISRREEVFNKLVAEKCKAYPQLAGLVADLSLKHYDEIATYFEKKKHPALSSAQQIRELKKETINIIKEIKIYEYKYLYLKTMFPDIEKYFEYDDVMQIEGDIEDNTDSVSFYISEEEYKTLSNEERNQLALDNYIAGNKSKWQIGRDYELYIGYLYKKKGYSIEYHGIVKRLEDLGRDIIATKNNTTLIIQCKNWAKGKMIHENHIFQLYGTLVYAKLENPLLDVKGIFVTSICLSDMAKLVARYLGIEVVENLQMGEFPRIKCNINRITKEKIYHLPFDQQYDSVQINEKTGECFAYSVKEAENRGFRRAWKFKG